MSVRQWFGIAGTSDGTATGTTSIAKIVNGVVSVVAATSDATLTLIKTAVEKIATEVTVGDGLAVQQGTASKLKCTEASAAGILADTAAIETATVKIAAEVGVGTGLLVRQPTAASFNCTEASAAAAAASLVAIDADLDVALSTRATEATVATLATQVTAAAILADTAAIETATVATQAAVEKMDDWDAVHDSPAGTDGVRQMLAAYADPSVLPADVSANGDDVRAVGSRKGETYVYKSRLDDYEDSSRGVARVERQGAASGRQAASAVIVAAGTGGRTYGIIIDAGAGGITVNLRADGVIGGAIIFQFVVAASTYASIDLLDFPYGNGLYGEINAGGGGFNVHFRND